MDFSGTELDFFHSCILTCLLTLCLTLAKFSKPTRSGTLDRPRPTTVSFLCLTVVALLKHPVECGNSELYELVAVWGIFRIRRIRTSVSCLVVPRL